MGPGSLWRASIALLCLLQVHDALGARRNVTQWLSLSPTMTVKSMLMGRHHLAYQRNSDYSDSRSSSKPSLRVTLPSLPCSSSLDCLRYSEPRLECRAGQCSCRPPYCWTYSYEALSFWTAKYTFECGTCGVLGSWCNGSVTCDFPGECWSDGYCHCPKGENENDVCMTTRAGWSLRIMVIGMAVLMIFAFSLLLWNCYKDPPWGQPGSLCFGLFNRNRNAEISSHSPPPPVRPSAVITSQHQASSDKTPAYTIQAHYNNRQVSCEGDQDESRPDEDLGATGGGHAAPHGLTVGGPDGEDNSSFSSVITSQTDGSSTQPADDPGPGTSLSETARRYRVFTIDVDSPPEATSQCQGAPSEGSESGDSSCSSEVSVGSCSHVRCELCLPRAPETQSASGRASPVSCRPQLPHLQARETVSAETAVKSTSL